MNRQLSSKFPGLRRLYLTPLVIVANMLSASSVHAEESFVPTFLSIFPNAEQFRHSRQQYDRYEALIGSINYVVGENAMTLGREGYRPAKTHLETGVVERYVFDHQRQDSALQIYRSLWRELEDKQFEILYSCEREVCGDVAGWKLYLSEYVDGDIDSQYYVLGRHPTRSGGQWLVALYVNEFSDRPRTLIDIVNSASQVQQGYAINADTLGVRLESGEEVPLRGVQFEFGSAELMPESKVQLDRLMNALVNEPELSVQIVGHTDDIGGEGFNKKLSFARAEAVKAFIVAKRPDLSDKISTKGVGAATPVASNNTHDGRAKNRRVTVARLKKQEG